VVAIKTKLPEAGLTKRGDWPMREAGTAKEEQRGNLQGRDTLDIRRRIVFGTTGKATASNQQGET